MDHANYVNFDEFQDNQIIKYNFNRGNYDYDFIIDETDKKNITTQNIKQNTKQIVKYDNMKSLHNMDDREKFICLMLYLWILSLENQKTNIN